MVRHLARRVAHQDLTHQRRLLAPQHHADQRQRDGRPSLQLPAQGAVVSRSGLNRMPNDPLDAPCKPGPCVLQSDRERANRTPARVRHQCKKVKTLGEHLVGPLTGVFAEHCPHIGWRRSGWLLRSGHGSALPIEASSPAALLGVRGEVSVRRLGVSGLSASRRKDSSRANSERAFDCRYVGISVRPRPTRSAAFSSPERRTLWPSAASSATAMAVISDVSDHAAGRMLSGGTGNGSDFEARQLSPESERPTPQKGSGLRVLCY